MNREQTAKALDALGVTVVYANDPVDGSRIEVVSLDDLARISSVFEEAHAPTDDEREALSGRLWDVIEIATSDSLRVEMEWALSAAERAECQAERDEAEAVRDAVIAAVRERRTVQGEPEWEYAYELRESDTGDLFDRGGAETSIKQAKEIGSYRAREENRASPEDLPPLTAHVARRRKAGPWEQVSQNM